ncbi:toxin-antitoxin system YwqK family antitoxin, partial [Candidatus Pseudothioglobus singularis]|nr:toxin-antitoxin system YwqK family antitoxin [Candidatus Pseudothioglobus singularis]
VTSWNENGGVWKMEQYEIGNLVQETHYIFYDNGKVKKARNYQNGLLNGIFTSWHNNGQKKSEVNYKDNIKDGKFTSWNETGQIESVVTFKDGVCVSESCVN